MAAPPRAIVALVLAAAVAVAAGCGDDGGGGSYGADRAGTTTAEQETSAGAQGSSKPRDLPKPLAANRAQANEILDEGSLDSKLAELEGFPIVVNQWGSWCPPCRAELPFFREVADERADEVAFLGIDMQDERAAAEQFLAEVPVPFPSVFDPSADAIRSLGGGVVSPTTVYIDESGEVVEVFQGEYTSRAQLERDIERNLLS